MLENLNVVFQKSYESLKNCAAQIVGEFRSEDVVHDVYLKMVDAKNIPSVNNLKAYLFRSVKNRALRTLGDIRRSTGNSEALETLAIEPQETSEVFNEPSNPKDVALMNLYRTGKKWYLKAPEVLGVSPGAARVRMSRLLSQLKAAV